MQRKSMAAVAALVPLTLGLLSGCGGGGGVGVGLGVGLGRTLDVVNPFAERAVLAIGMFDALAGVERMLAASNGYAVIEGPVGVDVRTACAGGGTIRVHKVSATIADLAPDTCRLRADDPLVYGGAWRFNITSSSYGVTGACPPGATCQLAATIDTSNARYGYGNPTDAVLGTRYQSVTDAAGARTANVTAVVGAESLPSVDGTVLSGTLDNLTLRLPGAVDWHIAGTAARQTLQVTSPFGATLTLGSTITAVFDDNRDGVADRTVSIPWSDFLP
jgi:hypothetical protein